MRLYAAASYAPTSNSSPRSSISSWRVRSPATLRLRIHRDAWAPLVEQFLFVALLILGYAAFGSLFDRQARFNCRARPAAPPRIGPAKLASGMAVGWGAVVVCVLAMVVIGGIAVVITTQPSAWPWLLADAAYFALLALGRRSRLSRLRISAFRCRCRIVGRGAWLCPVLCDRPRSCSPGPPMPASPSRSSSAFCSPRPICAPAPLAELGSQLRLEGLAGPHLRTGGQRRQQPFSNH